MRRQMITLPIAAAVAAGSLAACGSGSDSGSDGDGLDIVAAFYPLAFAAEQVGGDHVNVTNLTPAGQEPHDLELAPSDIASIEEADYVVYLAEFVPEIDEAVEQYAPDKSLEVSSVVDLLGYDSTQVFEDEHAHEDEHAEEEAEEEHDHEHGELEGSDPHVWLDPIRYSEIGQAVADGLAEADPDNAEDYTAGAEDFTAALTELDTEFTEGLSDRTSDAIVTSHAAFGYLADRYGLTQVAISGLSPDQEPNSQRMGEIAEYVEENQVTTIFFETLVSPDIAETIAAETGAGTATLDPLEGLASDDSDGDYFSIMRENLTTLQSALGAA